MMDPPAPALGAPELAAIRVRLDRFKRQLHQTPLDYDIGEAVALLLAAYDAQAAQLRATDQRDSARLFQVVRLEADLRLAQDKLDAQAARLAAYRGALEAIRDLDPLAGGVRPGPTSIGDTALAIANGLGQCQKLATAALEAPGAAGDGEGQDG